MLDHRLTTIIYCSHEIFEEKFNSWKTTSCIYSFLCKYLWNTISSYNPLMFSLKVALIYKVFKKLKSSESWRFVFLWRILLGDWSRLQASSLQSFRWLHFNLQVCKFGFWSSKSCGRIWSFNLQDLAESFNLLNLLSLAEGFNLMNLVEASVFRVLEEASSFWILQKLRSSESCSRIWTSIFKILAGGMELQSSSLVRGSELQSLSLAGGS